jgi:hypothetical protein
MPSTQLLRKKTKTHGGFRTVVYRDTAGQTHLAKVLSAGTGNTLNLRIYDRRRDNVAAQTLSNVAVATTMKSTNCWFNVTS